MDEKNIFKVRLLTRRDKDIYEHFCNTYAFNSSNRVKKSYFNALLNSYKAYLINDTFIVAIIKVINGKTNDVFFIGKPTNRHFYPVIFFQTFIRHKEIKIFRYSVINGGTRHYLIDQLNGKKIINNGHTYYEIENTSEVHEIINNLLKKHNIIIETY